MSSGSHVKDSDEIFQCPSSDFRRFSNIQTIRFTYRWKIDQFFRAFQLLSNDDQPSDHRQPYRLSQQHQQPEIGETTGHHGIGGPSVESNLDIVGQCDRPANQSMSRRPFIDSPLFAADLSRGLHWFVRLTAPIDGLASGQHYGLHLHLDRWSSWSDARAMFDARICTDDGTVRHWFSGNRENPGVFTVSGDGSRQETTASCGLIGTHWFLHESSIAEYLVDGRLTIHIDVNIFPLHWDLACVNLPDGRDGSSQLLRSFADLHARRHLVDVLLVTDDGSSFSAHRCLLVNRSPFFEAMFTGERAEVEQPTVTVSGITSDVFEEVMAFIYTDAAPPMLLLRPADLLAAAVRFGLERLVAMAENQLVEQLTVDNVCDTLLLADKFSRPYLKTTSMKFLIENGIAASETEGWTRLRDLLNTAEEALVAASHQLDAVAPPPEKRFRRS